MRCSLHLCPCSSRSRSKEHPAAPTMPTARHVTHAGRQEGAWSSHARPDPVQLQKKRQRAPVEASQVVDARPRDSLRHLFPNALVPPAQLRPSGELRPDDTYEQPTTSPRAPEPRKDPPVGSRAAAGEDVNSCSLGRICSVFKGWRTKARAIGDKSEWFLLTTAEI